MKKIDVTLITGALGAGKTTILKSIITQMKDATGVVWLKNEYGDVNIDAEVAKSLHIQTKEILNGCLCCVLIGKLSNALDEIISTFNPKHIFIETAGTAYPYPIINEVQKHERTRLDSTIMIVDVLHFEKIIDSSVIAKNQAHYFDLIIFNKHEQADTIQKEKVYDAIYEMYPSIPKVHTKNGHIDIDLVLGAEHTVKKNEMNLKETHFHNEADHIQYFSITIPSQKMCSRNTLTTYLASLPEQDFVRIKGIVHINDSWYILNVVRGRVTYDLHLSYSGDNAILFIGERIGILEKTVVENIKKIFTNNSK